MRARNDILTWAGALAAGAIATALCVAGGARLGAGLTLGTVLVIVVVLGRLAFERRT